MLILKTAQMDLTHFLKKNPLQYPIRRKHDYREQYIAQKYQFLEKLQKLKLNCKFMFFFLNLKVQLIIQRKKIWQIFHGSGFTGIKVSQELHFHTTNRVHLCLIGLLAPAEKNLPVTYACSGRRMIFVF